MGWDCVSDNVGVMPLPGILAKAMTKMFGSFIAVVKSTKKEKPSEKKRIDRKYSTDQNFNAVEQCKKSFQIVFGLFS